MLSVWKCFEMIKYKENSLPELRGSFNNDVFIYTSGQSAKNFPLIEYQNRKYIVVNGAVRVFIEKNIKPLAFVFDDADFIQENTDLVIRSIAFSEYIFMPKELFLQYSIEEKIPSEHRGKVFFINKVNKIDGVQQGSYRFFYFKNIFNKSLVFKLSRLFYKSKNIGFSKNISEGYFCARTIAYVALQLAYYLGFKRVFFVGLDLNASAGRFYDKKDPLPTTLDKDYPRHIYPSFELVAKRIVDESFEIYNLSTQSRLPRNIMPKITLDQLADLINGK